MNRLASWWGQIKRICFDFVVNGVASSYLCPKVGRRWIYNNFGMKIVTKNIHPKSHFSGNDIRIKEGCYIGYMCFFFVSGGITIEKDCNIAMKCTFVTSTHEIGNMDRRAGNNLTKEIHIGRGVWIGANTTILPGVTIGDGCIIAAGAVVVENCIPNNVYGGIPAKQIKGLNMKQSMEET
mgnify:CR=1 FL=1